MTNELTPERLAEIERSAKEDAAWIIQANLFFLLSAYRELAAENERLREAARWIPVSERLPPPTEKYGMETYNVLVGYTDGVKAMSFEWKTEVIRGKTVSRWYWHDRLAYADWPVVAWRPLPAAAALK